MQIPLVSSPTQGFRRLRTGLLAVAAAFLLPLLTHAQFSGPPTTQVHDTSALRPPAGARVAIVEFSDMECPQCSVVNPLLKAAAAKYHLPWLRHDFPLPYHPWSTQAAINSRWFDAKSKQLGGDYRDYIFANQSSIETPAQLNKWTQQFAQAHGISMPFAVDPQGALAAQVKADRALGERIGIDHTPTIWIVTDGTRGAAQFVEVVDHNKLYQIIDAAIAQTGGNSAPAKSATATKTAPKPTTRK